MFTDLSLAKTEQWLVKFKINLALVQINRNLNFKKMVLYYS